MSQLLLSEAQRGFGKIHNNQDSINRDLKEEYS